MLQLMKASAGSGKTYSLARQYISLLLKSTDRYAYRHILAVTFTNKATDEMKSRILKELHVMASDPSASDYKDYFVPSLFSSIEQMQEKARKVLQDVLHDYSAFAVSTIDRFFQQTLKAFSREIGHFASYQVELDRDSLVAESVDRVLDSLTEDSGAILSWLTENVLEQIEQGERYNMDANLKDMALRLQHPQRQDALSASGLKEEVSCSKERLMKIRSQCREIRAAFLESVKARSRAALDVLENAKVPAKESSYGFMAALYKYEELTSSSKIEKPTEAFFARAQDSEKWFAKPKAKLYLPLLCPELEAKLEDFCSLWEKEYKVYCTATILDKQIYGLGVAAELSNTFTELMKEKNVLCIDDSNVLLKRIIDGSDAPFVYEKLGVRYEHFLLDEFQDTSRVQWQNFSPLLQNSEAQGCENLIVGDVKQSIYRWRGSDWKLLDETIPAEFDGYKETVLDTNYRSLSNIVRFNSEFFAEAAEILDKIDGFEKDGPMSGIYADVSQEVAKKDKPAGNVKFSFCKEDSQLDEMLSEIHRARQSGARYSDIAVLVRSNATGENVATFLIDNGIPVVTDDSLKVKNALTVRRLVSLMSHVDNPNDTVANHLADMLSVKLPKSSNSLVDLAERLFRRLKEGDKEGLWKGELLHVQSFMDSISEYVSINGNNLRGFLKYWEGESPSISSPSSSDSVRVMTVHKSKGLDFPYVILPYAENIIMYKAGKHWCSPDLDGTPLQDVAEGVYDVSLSKDSADTLFEEDYKQENFLQKVDNLNILYVALTRAALGMHVIAKMPSAKLLSAVKDGKRPEFSDFSQLLYWYVARNRMNGFTCCETDSCICFEKGDMVSFNDLRKKDESEYKDFPITEGGEFPSIPLNIPNEEESEETDVRVRGRLKFSADSLDFFKDDQTGVSASNRIRGIVLHDILSKVNVPSDVPGAVSQAQQNGLLTLEEASIAEQQLISALSSAEQYGWFAPDLDAVYNEVSLIDSKGKVLRPDRVVINKGKVSIIDYKFGEHNDLYFDKVKQYKDLWNRMGYADVQGYLWYVDTLKVMTL